jgi:hypothetical protein
MHETFCRCTPPQATRNKNRNNSLITRTKPTEISMGNCYNEFHQKYKYQLFGEFYIYSKALNLTE